MALKLMLISEIVTEGDRWRYYAEDYAWRIIRLHDEEHTSPIDPDGKWYNGALVMDAVNRFRRQLAHDEHIREEHESRDPDIQAQNRRYARAAAWRAGKLDEYDAGHYRPPDNSAAEGRVLCNEWARRQGYADFAQVPDDGRNYSRVVAWILARRAGNHMPMHPTDRISRAEKERRREESRRPYSAPDRPIGDALRDIGISAEPAETDAG